MVILSDLDTAVVGDNSLQCNADPLVLCNITIMTNRISMCLLALRRLAEWLALDGLEQPIEIELVVCPMCGRQDNLCFTG